MHYIHIAVVGVATVLRCFIVVAFAVLFLNVLWIVRNAYLKLPIFQCLSFFELCYHRCLKLNQIMLLNDSQNFSFYGLSALKCGYSIFFILQFKPSYMDGNLWFILRIFRRRGLFVLCVCGLIVIIILLNYMIYIQSVSDLPSSSSKLKRFF